MKKYYKIITSKSIFKDSYNILDIRSIPFGTRFVAQKPKNPSRVILNSNMPVIHFCDSAVNTMLWYSFIFDGCIEPWLLEMVGICHDTCIYEIKPVSPVIYGVCRDEYHLYQCGANIVEFGEKIPVEQVVRNAVKEYKKHKIRMYTMYKHKIIKNQIKFWQRFYSL